jgi:hypothetical protein
MIRGDGENKIPENLGSVQTPPPPPPINYDDCLLSCQLLLKVVGESPGARGSLGI